jgi:D-beta-D-heptose 7-phosphate kinase/D-beta-D-heptose 1-phosphate adenosyltransferase
MDYPQQKHSKILVIGETCLDRYVFGACERISPEAPVPILNIEETGTLVKEGMASNVSTNIISLGQETDLVTTSNTMTKTRFIDKKTKQQILRVDEFDSCQPMIRAYLDLHLVNDYDATVISDYNKGFLTQEFLERIVPKLPQPVFVDTKKKDLSPFKNCIIKINESESKEIKNLPDSSKLIVTIGSRGAKYGGEILTTNPCEVIDVCGAGDTFLSALAVHYCQFKNIRDAIRFANKCARVTVQKTGVYNVTLGDLE